MHSLNKIIKLNNNFTSNQEPARLERASISQIDQNICKWIERQSLFRLISFHSDSFIPDQTERDLKNHQWSIDHWALWISQITNINLEFPVDLEEFKKDIMEIFHKKILTIQACPPNQFSKIVRDLGKLNCVDELIKNWIIFNAERNLTEFTARQLSLFINGAQKILVDHEMADFLKTYDKHFQKTSTRKEPLSQLPPKVIADILKAHQICQCKTEFANYLLDFIAVRKNNINFKLDEWVALIPGLNPRLFNDPEKVVDLLDGIELELVFKNIKDNWKTALKHFVTIGYIPELIFSKVKALLDDDKSIFLFDKIDFLYFAAQLGLRKGYSFANYFKLLLLTLEDQIPASSSDQPVLRYRSLNPEQIVQVLYAAAVFLEKDEASLINHELLQYALIKSYDLNPKMKNFLIDSLRALNYNEEARRVGKRALSTRVDDKQLITKYVQDWFKKTVLDVKIISNKRINGREVDILISGFSDIKLTKQKDIVISIVKPHQFACSHFCHYLGIQFKHYLGSYIIQKKEITNLGFEIRTFEENDEKDLKSRIEDFLETKWKNNWKGSLINW